ncbi:MULTISPECIES: hypothetical protein [Streptosporangium]|uniref:DUF2690 domain-containing protein n=1 Tax=Streptosporangium brasiliense TaxID=47480 RepID=A0ABT9RLP7_9ACTN|nr:hypothetical protein [Streptosporangium brasiliense]MDP9869210.1 hypothetical protein [Streptosporangium brasiliense]
MKRSIAQAAAVLLAVAGLTAALPASASAAGPRCQGYGCDATLASTTGCNAGSYVPKKEGAKVTTDRGVLRVFWGPRCSTNWGAFDPTVAGVYKVSIYREEVGDRPWIGHGRPPQRVHANEIPGVRLRTTMFYAPEAQVMVCVDVPAEGRVTAGSWTRHACTEWI